MTSLKLAIFFGREMFVSRLGDASEDLDLAIATCRRLLAAFPDHSIDDDDPKFDIERIKLVDFIQAGSELSALLRKRRSAELERKR